MTELAQVAALITELQATSSKLQKVEILRRYPQLKDILRRTYDPLIKYYVTAENIKRRGVDQHAVDLIDFRQVLDLLHSRSITGQAALDRCASLLVQLTEEEQDAFLGIIDKNLKGRIDSASINEAFPGLIEEPKCALASKYEDLKKPIDFVKETWFSSHKLDGNRLHAVVDSNTVTFLSRSGHEFETLGALVQPILDLAQGDCVLDGEVCVIDENGNEDFQGIMKEIKRKNHTIARPKFFIFDCLTPEEFKSGTSTAILSERLARIGILPGNGMFEKLEQTRVESQEHLDRLFAESQEKGWEGLILRKDCPYEAKRTKNMLKMKAFEDAEYKVIGVEFGNIRYVKDGREAEEKMLSAVVIEHEGNPVSVGSGFSIEERQRFYAHPEQIMGKIITVKYFQTTKNQQGTTSLRFPTVKAIHGDARIT